ncbi:MAG TPA: hypothetical protein PL051_03930 [Candidatus Saccharibacteria bacterium]|nr:hypothetical protein [Candidatus Saccharibacteria bacterium]
MIGRPRGEAIPAYREPYLLNVAQYTRDTLDAAEKALGEGRVNDALVKLDSKVRVHETVGLRLDYWTMLATAHILRGDGDQAGATEYTIDTLTHQHAPNAHRDVAPLPEVPQRHLQLIHHVARGVLGVAARQQATFVNSPLSRMPLHIENGLEYLHWRGEEVRDGSPWMDASAAHELLEALPPSTDVSPRDKSAMMRWLTMYGPRAVAPLYKPLEVFAPSATPDFDEDAPPLSTRMNPTPRPRFRRPSVRGGNESLVDRLKRMVVDPPEEI